MAGRRPPATIRAPATTPAVTQDSTSTRCRGLASGPMVVPSAVGSPTTNPAAWETSADTASSYRLRGASTRDMVKHACPELAKHRQPSSAATAPRSTSLSTIAADLPPSSRVTGLRLSPQIPAIRRPAAVGPATATTSTPGCAASISATWPVPVTRLNTPGGKSAASNASARMYADSEVSAAGLSTTVQPAARAGATWQKARISG